MVQKWNSSEMGRFYRQENIVLRYNPPCASHYGGHFERLIKSTKRILVTTRKQHSITDESLVTFLCEAESQLNSRPLTPIFTTDVNSDEPLTPNHLLLLEPKTNFPPGHFEKTDCYSQQRFKQIQYLSDIFWKRWTTEFLTSLQERQRWCTIKNNLEKGDLVLLVEDTQPRNSWITGRILSTFPDKNGLVRQVELKTPTGVLKRPIRKLCLLLKANPTDDA